MRIKDKLYCFAVSLLLITIASGQDVSVRLKQGTLVGVRMKSCLNLWQISNL